MDRATATSASPSSYSPAACHPLTVARRRERFSLRELAVVTGINFRRISAIELGAKPSPIESRILAAALRIPIRELLDPEGVRR
jgi:transcriptional regulator with XRE-family HTH domain